MPARATIAIVGAGRVSSFQLEALRRLPGHFALLGLCDVSPAARAAAGDLPTFPSLDALLARHQPDAVVVSTPNSTHAAVAHQALAAGCAVLLEKPATRTLGELQELIGQAERRGLPLHTALHASFAPDIRWVAEHREELAAWLGPVTALSSRFLHPYRVDGHLDPATASLGGSWVDLGINALCSVDRLVDDLRLVSLHREPGHPTGDLRARADLRFATAGQADPGHAVIETSWVHHRSHKATELVCALSGCRIELLHSRHRVTLRHADGRCEVLLDAHQPGGRRLDVHYQHLFEDFARVLAGGADNRARSLRLHRMLLGPAER